MYCLSISKIINELVSGLQEDSFFYLDCVCLFWHCLDLDSNLSRPSSTFNIPGLRFDKDGLDYNTGRFYRNDSKTQLTVLGQSTLFKNTEIIIFKC